MNFSISRASAWFVALAMAFAFLDSILLVTAIESDSQ